VATIGGNDRPAFRGPRDNAAMHSVPAFLAVAAALTLAPGPALALLLQVAAVHGRRVALATIAGNSLGVLAWSLLSAAGVSALVAASQLAYELLHFGGAAFLLWLGLRALLARAPESAQRELLRSDRGAGHPARRAAGKGLVNSLANPKLALFFVSLFPQLAAPGGAVGLPTALAMASVIVAFDVAWYGMLAFLVDRVSHSLTPRLMRRLERFSGVVLFAFGLRVATETR
jgi:threonine/homoserine/homoserine lactone efflux protein